MALVFVDGFDHYNIADILKKWSTFGPGVNSTASMDTGRISGQSLKLVTTSGSPSHLRVLGKAFSSLNTTGGIGFAFKTTAYPTPYGTQQQPTGARCLAILYDGTYNHPHLVLVLNIDGTLSVIRTNTNSSVQPWVPAFTSLGSGGSVPLSTWVYIEWKWYLHDSSGTSTVRINGVTVITVTATDTIDNGSMGGVGCTSILLGGAHPSMGADISDWQIGGANIIGTVWLDDIYMFDGNTGVTDFLGDITVNTKLVTANGTTNNGTPSAGSNYQCVDEALADSADYVTLDAVNEIDTYQIADVPAGTVIKGVQVTALAKRTQDGTVRIAAETRQSGANYVHPTEQGVTTDYAFRPFIYEKDALGAAWTDAGKSVV